MFNSSLRRVARTCPNSALSARPCSPTPSHAYGSVAAAFSTRSHQRRNSSSKPPIPPNNGAPPIPAASVKQVGAPRTTDKRPGATSRLSKRATTKVEKVDTAKQKEDPSSEWVKSLPSVPSTQHLNEKDIYVASFFSTHRPLSISGPLPPESSLEDVDKIFQVRPKSQRKAQDVIYTISSAIQNLDDQTASHQQRIQAGQHEESITQKADLIKALTRHNDAATNSTDSNVHHLDGQPQNATSLHVGGGNVKMVIQALARQFRPFNPPPAPTAVPEVEFFDPQASEEASTKLPVLEQKVEQALRSKADSVNNFFTPSFNMAGRAQRGTLSARHLYEKHRFQIRDLRRIGGLREMLLISVKRQRRLKMKKHKYKKLQRKTRNLRRRQGKI